MHIDRRVAICLLSLSIGALSQTQRGQIVGEVTDPAGSVVPAAKVELVNPSTGVRHETVTGPNGSYTFPLLNYGKYDLKVSAPGFAPTGTTSGTWAPSPVPAAP